MNSSNANRPAVEVAPGRAMCMVLRNLANIPADIFQYVYRLAEATDTHEHACLKDAASVIPTWYAGLQRTTDWVGTVELDVRTAAGYLGDYTRQAIQDAHHQLTRAQALAAFGHLIQPAGII